MTASRTGKKPEIVVAAVIVERGLVLLTRRSRPPAALMWHLPGGGVEFGESLHDALIRELDEEVGVTIAVDGRMPVAISSTVYPEVDRHAVTLYFRARIVSGSPSPKDGTDAVDWFGESRARAIANGRALLEPSATTLKSVLGWKV
jgi:8-oxo-dGTP diphosphatase